MGSLFKSFSILTWGNLVVQALFLVIAIIGAPKESSNLWTFLALCPAFLHTNLCVRMIKKLGKATMPPLGVAFKTTLIVTGIYSILLGIALIGGMITVMSQGTLMGRINTQGDPAFLRTVEIVANIFLSCLVIHGATMATNSIISFVYLKRWEKLIYSEEDSLLTFDAATTNP